MQQLTVSRSAATQGYALEFAAKRKSALHGAPCHQAGIQFIPLPVETVGGWSAQAASTIQEIGRRQANRLDTAPSDSIRHLFQRLSICLWRGNASIWLNASPDYPSSFDGVE